MNAKFEGKGTVSVRVGGKGAEWVGKEVHAKTKAGGHHVVRLLEVVMDYGPGDVVIFRVEFSANK